MPEINRRDVQGLVATGYGSLNCATYLLLAVDDAASARSWLGVHLDDVASAYGRAEPTATNVAFTTTGLQKLGLASALTSAFSFEFNEGIVSPHRSRILGDVDESDPAAWQWGGPTTDPVDLLLLLFATDAAELAKHEASYTQSLTNSGMHLLRRLETQPLRVEENFGFHDGISQPSIDGLSRAVRPGDVVKTGEFLLGYPNEYDLYTGRPLLARNAASAGLLPAAADVSSQGDLGANGTYLVFRQLEQDVRGFWSFLDAVARDAAGNSDAAERVRLGAKMVGRWPGGAPLVVSDHDDAAL
ncbi:MAG TPA: peroxidase, partial [Dehalococcoidia bacterium]|nr:peroxidase [Dehalococcoidia bacterium]